MSDMSAPSKNILVRNLPVLAIIAAAIIGAITLKDYLSFDALAQNRDVLIGFRDQNYAITALLFVLAYVLVVAFSLPGATIATLTGGFLFGPVFGTMFNVTGATTGATLIFLAARFGFGDALAARMEASDGAVKKIKDGIDENQCSMLFVMRLVPVVPFFVANIVPALVNVPLHRYVISTFLGIIPGALVYTSVGSGLGTVFESGETPNLGIIFEPHVLLPILGLAALSLVPVIIKAVTGKKDTA
ncbi:MAG: TVP38/TMEM64 family protein [Rhodobacteraceae bacterium]|nr:TVP38/TMEM64 family protein [Paracoccaceae bacterium]